MNEEQIREQISNELCENVVIQINKNNTDKSMTELERNYLEDQLVSARMEIERLKDRLTGYNDDEKCFHECPECQGRCNCTCEKCNHCKELEEECNARSYDEDFGG